MNKQISINGDFCNLAASLIWTEITTKHYLKLSTRFDASLSSLSINHTHFSWDTVQERDVPFVQVSQENSCLQKMRNRLLGMTQHHPLATQGG